MKLRQAPIFIDEDSGGLLYQRWSGEAVDRKDHEGCWALLYGIPKLEYVTVDQQKEYALEAEYQRLQKANDPIESANETEETQKVIFQVSIKIRRP